jgi:hypothetical protein
MGFIPEGAEWYLAEIVEEITVEGVKGSDIHINLVLIHAKTPDEAHQKSLLETQLSVIADRQLPWLRRK